MKAIRLTKDRVAIVDDVDYVRLNAVKWYANFTGQNWYAKRRVGTKFQYMHIAILENGLKPREQVFHIDGDGLNNRRNNLIIVTADHKVVTKPK